MPKQTFFNLPEEKRAAIVDAALDEFAENDYERASISRIVARTGIAKGSFYQYFEDKEDLFRYLISLIAERKAEMFSLEQPDPEHIGLFNYIRWTFEISVQFEADNPRLSKIGYRMLRGGASENTVFQDAMEGARTYYLSLVALGKAQGDIDPTLDDEITAEIFRVVMSETGRYIVEQMVARHGTAWQGEQAIFDFPEARAMYKQMLQILEFGMGAKPFPRVEAAADGAETASPASEGA